MSTSPSNPLAAEEVLREWIGVRDRYAIENVAVQGADQLAYQVGFRPVLVTALHATPHRRGGSAKIAESESGALAQAFATVATYGYLTAVGPQTGDANWDESHPFRERLAALLAQYSLVLDFHMMLDSHGPDICLGLGPSPNAETGRLASLSAYEAESRGLVTSVNWPFLAEPRTVTAFVQAQSKSAMQVEIATRVQRPTDEPILANKLLAWLSRVDAHVAELWG